MNQSEFSRRAVMHGLAGVVGAAAAAGIPGAFAAKGEALRFWAPGIAKVAAKDFSAMAAQAGIGINRIAKSARADEAIQKMVVGDGSGCSTR